MNTRYVRSFMFVRFNLNTQVVIFIYILNIRVAFYHLYKYKQLVIGLSSNKNGVSNRIYRN
ncbi:hypothetical protein Hanom_Chr07g00670551 [Helianthus anomalus]